MRIKEGVRIAGARPELLFGLLVAEDVFRGRGFDLIVTSVLEGNHHAGSLHYKGLAADVRTRHLPEGMKRVLHDELQTALGTDWDVVLESDHLHLEYDVKA